MLSEAYKTVVNEYEVIVTSLDDPKIVKAALTLAYYVAMLDACIDDPMDDPEEQQEAVESFNDMIKAATLTFQTLVNEVL